MAKCGCACSEVGSIVVHGIDSPQPVGVQVLLVNETAPYTLIEDPIDLGAAACKALAQYLSLAQIPTRDGKHIHVWCIDGNAHRQDERVLPNAVIHTDGQPVAMVDTIGDGYRLHEFDDSPERALSAALWSDGLARFVVRVDIEAGSQPELQAIMREFSLAFETQHRLHLPDRADLVSTPSPLRRHPLRLAGDWYHGVPMRFEFESTVQSRDMTGIQRGVWRDSLRCKVTADQVRAEVWRKVQVLPRPVIQREDLS